MLRLLLPPTPTVAIFAILSLVTASVSTGLAQSPSEKPARQPYLYAWNFEAGGLPDSEFRGEGSGGELTIAGGETDHVPLFQRKGGVSEASPGVLNASRNTYGSTGAAQINSFGSPLRTGKSTGQLTITMWIKPAIPVEKQPEACLLNLSPGDNELAPQSLLIALKGDSFSFHVNGCPWFKLEPTESVVKPGEWTFLVFCYDGLAEGIYHTPAMVQAVGADPNATVLAGDLSNPTHLICKIPISTGAPAYNVSPGAVSLDGLLVAIGSSNSRYDRSFVGWIDDVRIFNGLLPLSELEQVRLEATEK